MKDKTLAIPLCNHDIFHLKNKILIVAASLLTDALLSDHQEDWTVRVPKTVLREIEKHNEKLQSLSIKLTEAIKDLK